MWETAYKKCLQLDLNPSLLLTEPTKLPTVQQPLPCDLIIHSSKTSFVYYLFQFKIPQAFDDRMMYSRKKIKDKIVII